MKSAVNPNPDRVGSGTRPGASGPAVVARCQQLNWTVASTHLLPDDPAQIQTLLRQLADGNAVDLILTTGGTGLGPRDSTPEATQAVADRLIPGIPEHMRRTAIEHTPHPIFA